MHRLFCTGALGAALLLSAWPSAAQPAAPRPDLPDPLNPRAAVPPLVHVSPLARYKPAGETRLGDWKAANDTVNRIGGWRAYAREAQAPAASAPADVLPAPMRPSPRAGGHGHH